MTLLALPALRKGSKSKRTCIIPASKTQLVFMLKYHKAAANPRVIVSSFVLTGARMFSAAYLPTANVTQTRLAFSVTIQTLDAVGDMLFPLKRFMPSAAARTMFRSSVFLRPR